MRRDHANNRKVAVLDALNGLICQFDIKKALFVEIFFYSGSILKQVNEINSRKASDIVNFKIIYLIVFSIHKICDQLKTISLLTRLLHYHRKVFNNVLLSFIRFQKG